MLSLTRVTTAQGIVNTDDEQWTKISMCLDGAVLIGFVPANRVRLITEGDVDVVDCEPEPEARPEPEPEPEVEPVTESQPAAEDWLTAGVDLGWVDPNLGTGVTPHIIHADENPKTRDARRALWGPPQPTAEEQAAANALLLRNIRRRVARRRLRCYVEAVHLLQAQQRGRESRAGEWATVAMLCLGVSVQSEK
jgi:hypothetical protein